MLLSPLTPEVFLLIAYLQMVTFGWDWLSRICVVWMTPIPHDAQKVQSHHIQQAYRYTPYFYICWGGGLCAMVFETLSALYHGAIFGSFLLQQGLLFGFMGLLTGLPLWGCRGLLRAFSAGQGLVVTLAAIFWPSVFSQHPFSSALSMFHPNLPWLLTSSGGYTLCFVVTAQWRRPLPLRGQSVAESREQ